VVFDFKLPSYFNRSSRVLCDRRNFDA
jgi:hypothetical protein